MSVHFHKLSVKNLRRETADCVSVAFDIPAALQTDFQFKPGQNITIRHTLNGKELRRSYSICSSPHEGELRIAIKVTKGGTFSPWANRELKKGDVLELLPPTGNFYASTNPAHKKNYLAIAAGSGITPVLSMIKSTLKEEPAAQYTLVYGNRNRASIMFQEQLNGLKNLFMTRFAIHHVLSGELPDAEIYSGRIDASKCEELAHHLVDFDKMDEVFLCGPAAMIFSVRDWLTSRGFSPKNIHFELFTTEGLKQAVDLPNIDSKPMISGGSATVEAPAAAETIPGPGDLVTKMSRVTIKLDGLSFELELPYEGPSILEAGLARGADLPFSCKGGICSTCRACITEGAVEMDINYALEADELAAGFVLTCQAHPRTDRVTVDFDRK